MITALAVAAALTIGYQAGLRDIPERVGDALMAWGDRQCRCGRVWLAQPAYALFLVGRFAAHPIDTCRDLRAYRQQRAAQRTAGH